MHGRPRRRQRPQFREPPGDRLALGPQLRPIVLGRGGSSSPEDGELRPAVALSVRSASGQSLGYVVFDRARQAAWGEMTVSDVLTLDDACLLARATTAQLRLFGIAHGSHHCLLTVPRGATPADEAAQMNSFLEALEPMLESGLCRIVYTRGDRSSGPSFARRAVVTSATASTLAALEHAEIDPARATVAVHRPTRLGADVVASLGERGLRPASAGAEGAAPADVLVVDGRVWSLGAEDATALRARVVVSLAAVVATLSVHRMLHRRRVLLVPETVAGAGALVAADLKSKGLRETSALSRTFALVHTRLRALLEAGDGRGYGLPGAVSAATARP